MNRFFLAALVAASISNSAFGFDLDRFIAEHTDASNAKVDDLTKRVYRLETSKAMNDKNFAKQVYNLRNEVAKIKATGAQNAMALKLVDERLTRLEKEQNDIALAVVEIALDNEDQESHLTDIDSRLMTPVTYLGVGGIATPEGLSFAGNLSIIGINERLSVGGSFAVGSDIVLAGGVGKSWDTGLTLLGGGGWAGANVVTGTSLAPTVYIAGVSGQMIIPVGDIVAFQGVVVAGPGEMASGKTFGVAGSAALTFRLGGNRDDE